MRVWALIFMVSVCWALQAHALVEKQCHKRCLDDGKYSITCDAICEVDETLAPSYTQAERQYKCLNQCQTDGKQTLTRCVGECRKQVRTQILADKDARMLHSITRAEEIINQQQDEVEQIIKQRVTSHKIEKKKLEPLVIE